MQLRIRQPLLSSTVAFILAGLLAITIHEMSHVVTALLLGTKIVLFPNFVNDKTASLLHRTITAGVGPIFSIVMGLIIIWVTLSWGKNFWQIVTKWFGFLSAQIGLVYLCIAPFIKSSDIGQVMSYWHNLWPLEVLVLIIGTLGFVALLPYLFERSFSPYASDKQSFLQIGLWPWLHGTAALVIIYGLVMLVIASRGIDNPGIASLLSIATIGVFTPIANYNRKSSRTDARQQTLRTPTAGLVLVTLLALLIIFWLSHGLALGQTVS